jgi:predicted ArsR family transcriptional regulator
MSGMPDATDFDAQVAGLAALSEPVRRSLYRLVAMSREPVNRDQAADRAGVPRHVAKFHLDKLVDEGLLDAEYHRPAGRSGPGAGRPAKFYRRSARELSVTVPERRYELAGRVLAQAVTDAQSGEPLDDALRAAAWAAGRSLGLAARDRAGSRPSRAALDAATRDTLRREGFEPVSGPDGVLLANCPFHGLAADFTDLVCGLNLELMGGLVDGLGRTDVEPVLEPTPGACCVRFRSPSTAPTPTAPTATPAG